MYFGGFEYFVLGNPRGGLIRLVGGYVSWVGRKGDRAEWSGGGVRLIDRLWVWLVNKPTVELSRGHAEERYVYRKNVRSRSALVYCSW